MSPWIWLLGLGVVAAAAGGAKATQTFFVGTPPPAPPPPPQAGEYPHPDVPDDDDAGRVYTGMGVALTAGEKTDHDRVLLQLADNAKGEILVDIWETFDGPEGRCTASRYKLRVDKGRLVSTQVLASDAVCAGANGPATLGFKRTLRFASKGRDLVIEWRATGLVNVDEEYGGTTGLEGFDPEEQPFGFVYLDALWKA